MYDFKSSAIGIGPSMQPQLHTPEQQQLHEYHADQQAQQQPTQKLQHLYARVSQPSTPTHGGGGIGGAATHRASSLAHSFDAAAAAAQASGLEAQTSLLKSMIEKLQREKAVVTAQRDAATQDAGWFERLRRCAFFVCASL